MYEFSQLWIADKLQIPIEFSVGETTLLEIAPRLTIEIVADQSFEPLPFLDHAEDVLLHLDANFVADSLVEERDFHLNHPFRRFLLAYSRFLMFPFCSLCAIEAGNQQMEPRHEQIPEDARRSI